MSQFPRIDLAIAHDRHGRLLTKEQIAYDRDVIVNAVEAYDQLSDRLVRDRAEWSLQMAELRQQLADARRASCAEKISTTALPVGTGDETTNSPDLAADAAPANADATTNHERDEAA